MELIKCIPLLVVIASTAAQYDSYDGYENYHRPIVHQSLDEHRHQSLDEHHGNEEYDLDYHAHPKYSFDYSVKDPHTGDNKDHWETRDGDKVKGSYTLLETDGTKRVVEYEADDKNGFNAVVHKIGIPKEEPEEYKVVQSKPVYENYPHEYNGENYQQLDGGFVPIVGGYEH
ncbi:larval cuticle protein A1A-like [Aricia agestis]|uniref:larval cuticle protein A1A-like n=1 Tax=Aricia agestis TaxID=91739 RepID=UPI001C20A535|nr:larval cuticle protein A1A-like [Aricia agestis]